MEWNLSEDCVNTRAHSEIDRLHSFKISNMDNVYPLLPGTRIRLEVIGEMFEDGRWREIHGKPLARVQAYDIYYHRAKQARASRPPASPAPSPPPALRRRRRVNLSRVPPKKKKKRSAPHAIRAPCRERGRQSHCSTQRTTGPVAASVTGRVPLPPIKHFLFTNFI